MGTVRYTTIACEVMSENRNGVIRDYLPDSLGSTVGLLDSTQTITDTFEYWPYGEVRAKSGTNATPLKFIGTQGYFTDSSSKTYVRARTLDTQKGRWTTKDPIGFAGGDWNVYRYSNSSPMLYIDPSGLLPLYRRHQPCRPLTHSGLACEAVTNGYANDYMRTGVGVARCASCVSTFVCAYLAACSCLDQIPFPISIITPPILELPCSMAPNITCQNWCMFAHWRAHDLPEWVAADIECRKNPHSYKCCSLSVIAEQAGYTKCAPLCGLLNPPHQLRESFAINVLKCCGSPTSIT